MALRELGAKGHCFYYVCAWWIFGSTSFYACLRYLIAAVFEDWEFCLRAVWPLVVAQSGGELVDPDAWRRQRVAETQGYHKVDSEAALLNRMRRSNMHAGLDEACALCALFGLPIRLYTVTGGTVHVRAVTTACLSIDPLPELESERASKLAQFCKELDLDVPARCLPLVLGNACRHYKIVLGGEERGQWQARPTNEDNGPAHAPAGATDPPHVDVDGIPDHYVQSWYELEKELGWGLDEATAIYVTAHDREPQWEGPDAVDELEAWLFVQEGCGLEVKLQPEAQMYIRQLYGDVLTVEESQVLAALRLSRTEANPPEQKAPGDCNPPIPPSCEDGRVCTEGCSDGGSL